MKTQKAVSKIAKQVEGYTLDLSKDCTAEDALPKEVYDCNIATSKIMTSSEPGYFKVDSKCWGKKLICWSARGLEIAILGANKGGGELLDFRSGYFTGIGWNILHGTDAIITIGSIWGGIGSYTSSGPATWMEVSCE